MIQGRIVTTQTAQELQGVFIDDNTFFDFVQDVNDNYFLFLSEQDGIDLLNTQYSYLLEIPLSEFIPKPIPPIS
jgi:hypothetical protein